MLKRFLVFAAVLMWSHANAEPIPNRYYFDYILIQNWGARSYFQCDYTSRTCIRGVQATRIASGAIIGEVLAEDRKTVVGHMMAIQDWQIDYDTGKVLVGRMEGIFTTDIPNSCDFRHLEDNFPPCEFPRDLTLNCDHGRIDKCIEDHPWACASLGHCGGRVTSSALR
jgi:hypothetical protein